MAELGGVVAGLSDANGLFDRGARVTMVGMVASRL
jgi:hypothetical protein